MKKLFTTIIPSILYYLNKLNNYLNREHSLKLISLSYSQSGRYLIYNYHNSSLKNHREVLFNLYTSLMNNDRFIKFGFNKVIITSAVILSSEYSFHHNVLITNNTAFDEYYNQVIDYIDLHYNSEDSYGVDIIPAFKVKVWNMDNYLNKKIKINNNNTAKISNKRNYSTRINTISPIKNNIVTDVMEPISSMDI